MNEKFEKRAAIARRRITPHGWLIGMEVIDCAPGQVRMRIPYHPVFVGDDASGIIHGGVATTLLDECSGAAVQLALEDFSNIATLDLRIDYMRPAKPGVDLRAHAHCYRVTRSIAFVRAVAYQESEDDPVASAAAAFMISAHRGSSAGSVRDGAMRLAVTYDMLPKLETPGDSSGDELKSCPYARFLGVQMGEDGVAIMPYHVKLTGNPVLPALHGGSIGAFLETTATIGVAREIGPNMQPRPIGLTVNYLRSGKALDTFASVEIVKQGRRIVAFQAQAWQKDRSLPIASTFGHFMLKQEHGADEG